MFTAAIWAFGFAFVPGAGVAAQAWTTEATTKDSICCHKCGGEEDSLKFETYSKDWASWCPCWQITITQDRKCDNEATDDVVDFIRSKYGTEMQKFDHGGVLKEMPKSEINIFLKENKMDADTVSAAMPYFVGAAQLKAFMGLKAFPKLEASEEDYKTYKKARPILLKECSDILSVCKTKSYPTGYHAIRKGPYDDADAKKLYKRACTDLRKEEMTNFPQKIIEAIDNVNKEEMEAFRPVCEGEAKTQRDDHIKLILEDKDTSNIETKQIIPAMHLYDEQCLRLLAKAPSKSSRRRSVLRIMRRVIRRVLASQ